MMIHAGHQNKEITVVAQCSLNTVRTIWHELENCDRDYEAVARRKQHNRRSVVIFYIYVIFFICSLAFFLSLLPWRSVGRFNFGCGLQKLNNVDSNNDIQI